MNKQTITLAKSLAGRPKRHTATVRCLGLSKIGQSKAVTLNAQTKGMINQVAYLLKIEDTTHVS